MLRHDVQLMLVQLRQQVLRQDEAVDVCRVEFQPRPAAPCSDEPDVELRIVGRQRSPVHEFQKRRQCFLRRRRVRQHGIRNARQADDLRRQPTAGVHEGLKRIRDLPVFSTTAPISVMASRCTFNPVVSMSKHTISSSKS